MTRFERLAVAVCALFPLLGHAGQQVDVNAATAEEIAAALDGVGMSKAQAIVQYRSEHGPFRAVDDLTAVKGIGRATLERNREFVVLDEKPAAAPKPSAAKAAK